MEWIAKSINTLGTFLGRRDIPALMPEVLKARIGSERVDVAVLFGGSILCGVDVFAQAIQNEVACKYIIVGGAGHTTKTLRDIVRPELSSMDVDQMSEAELFAACLETEYGLQADYLECRSTNCGNNITFLLDLVREHGLPCTSVLLMQDATMQLRMDAGMRKHAPGIQTVNYATYRANVTDGAGRLEYVEPIRGMWNMRRYISLLMGEVPRLVDTADGYGPNGRAYIAHVDLPPDVLEAFETLKSEFPELVREANPLYASQA